MFKGFQKIPRLLISWGWALSTNKITKLLFIMCTVNNNLETTVFTLTLKRNKKLQKFQQIWTPWNFFTKIDERWFFWRSERVLFIRGPDGFDSWKNIQKSRDTATLKYVVRCWPQASFKLSSPSPVLGLGWS